MGSRLDWENDPALRALREEFVASFGTKSQELLQCIPNSPEEAQRHVHQLAGSAGSYGFPNLSEFAALLDEGFDREDEATVLWEGVRLVCEILNDLYLTPLRAVDLEKKVVQDPRSQALRRLRS